MGALFFESHYYMKVCLSNGFRLYHHKLNIKLLYYISVLYSYTIKNLTAFRFPPIFRILIVLVMLVRYENEKNNDGDFHYIYNKV